MVLVHDIPQCSNPLMQMTNLIIVKMEDLEKRWDEAMKAAEQQVTSVRDEIRHIAVLMSDALDKNDEDGIMLMGIMLLPINNVHAQFMARYNELLNGDE